MGGELDQTEHAHSTSAFNTTETAVAHLGLSDASPTLGAAFAVEHAALGQVAHHLVSEKWVAGGPVCDLSGQSGNRRVATQQLGD